MEHHRNTDDACRSDYRNTEIRLKTTWAVTKDDPLPDQAELDKYLSEIACADEILLHANGPILKNYTGVCLDLRVILVSLQDSEIDDPESMFDSINHVRNTEEGIFPLAKRTWPPSFGRWEIDWLSRGYFRPTYNVGDLPISSVTQNESSVEYFSGTVSIWCLEVLGRSMVSSAPDRCWQLFRDLYDCIQGLFFKFQRTHRQ